MGASGKCFGSVIVPHVQIYLIMENKLNCYADDTTLMVVAPSPGDWLADAKSLNRDLVALSKLLKHEGRAG